MVKWTVAIAALASLPMLAAAQPAAPSLPSVDPQRELQARMEEFVKLQSQQLQASVPVPDEIRACIYMGGLYSEGAEIRTTDNTRLACVREKTPQGFSAPAGQGRLIWVRGQ